jgi:hypothetical protein
VKCWASVLGGCEGGQSGEHIVSASIFSSRSIIVAGHIWNASHPKVIGVSSLTANILCVAHNSSLSPVDAAAGHAMAAFRGLVDAQERRRRIPPRCWPFVYRFQVNGALFERFLLKTLINMVVARDPGHSWPGGLAHDQPPLNLVEAALGRRVLRQPAGAHFLGDPGDQIISGREGLEAFSLVSDTNECHGAAFLFRGFPFFLWLLEDRSPYGSVGFSLSSLLHRPRQVNGTVAGYPSHQLLLEGW